MTYKFCYQGKVAEGSNVAKVKKNLARAFQVTEDELQPLFNGKQEFVRDGLDKITAKSYTQIFKRAGAIGKVTKTSR